MVVPGKRTWAPGLDFYRHIFPHVWFFFRTAAAARAMDFCLARAKVAAARAKVPRQCSKVQSRSNEKHVGCDACCDEEKANDPHLVAA